MSIYDKIQDFAAISLKDSISPATVADILTDLLENSEAKAAIPVQVPSVERMNAMIAHGECIEGQIYFTAEDD